MCISKVRQLVPEISMDEIASAVYSVYIVSMKRLLNAKYKDKRVIEARHMCIYIMTLKTRNSMRKISSYFAMLDHSSAIYVKAKMRKLAGRDSVTFERLGRVISKTG